MRISSLGFWGFGTGLDNSEFFHINPCTNICPSCGNIISIKMAIKNELTGEETCKTFNFRPYFCIENHIFAHNSQVGPWSYLMPHIFQKLLAIRFFWCIALVWDRKFLLSGFLASVNGSSSSTQYIVHGAHHVEMIRSDLLYSIKKFL